MAYCPGDGSRQGAHVVGYSQEKKVTARVGVRVGVRQEWEEARNGKILPRSFRRRERGSPEPSRVSWRRRYLSRRNWVPPFSNWASCHVIRGGDLVGEDIGRRHKS